MANPFLVLGGVAVGVITAGIGVLAVPGWIDSAHDSAAMNDLGNIRQAQSAAVLQLGSYTDDIDVLRSGDLGVRAQPSDGVTLIDVNANGSDSWCAAVQSKSGKFFAASDATGKIATGASGAAAATAARCSTDAIAGIGAGGTIEAAPLGPVITAQAFHGVAVTPHGVYGGMLSWPDGFFARSGADGKAHKVDVTGPIMDSGYYHWERGMFADRAGNLYVIGMVNLGEGAGGEIRSAVYRVAPDGVSALIYMHQTDAGGSAIGVAPDGALFFAAEGSIWKVSDPGAAAPSAPVLVGSHAGYAPKRLAIDGAQNVYFTEGGAMGADRVMKMAPGGGISVISVTDGGNPASIAEIVATADGKLYGSSGTGIFEVLPSGERALIATPMSEMVGGTFLMPVLGAVDADGSFYFSDRTGMPGVYKLTAGGVYSDIIRN